MQNKSIGGSKVHVDDESDDKFDSSEDVFATKEEVFQAAAFARSDESNVRLLIAAKFILGKTKQSKRFQEPEDLLQDAIEAVLSGRRRWAKNRVDFRKLLFGVMRSLASNQEKKLPKKTLDVTMEHELQLVGDEQEPQNLEEMAVDADTPEKKLLRREMEAIEESRLAILRSKYGPDDLIGRILDEVKNGFVSHLEVCKALGIEESVYRNAWKKLMRAADSLNESAKE